MRGRLRARVTERRRQFSRGAPQHCTVLIGAVAVTRTWERSRTLRLRNLLICHGHDTTRVGAARPGVRAPRGSPRSVHLLHTTSTLPLHSYSLSRVDVFWHGFLSRKQIARSRLNQYFVFHFLSGFRYFFRFILNNIPLQRNFVFHNL